MWWDGHKHDDVSGGMMSTEWTQKGLRNGQKHKNQKQKNHQEGHRKDGRTSSSCNSCNHRENRIESSTKKKMKKRLHFTSTLRSNRAVSYLLLQSHRFDRIQYLEHLQLVQLHVSTGVLTRALPYLACDGRELPVQLFLFTESIIVSIRWIILNRSTINYCHGRNLVSRCTRFWLRSKNYLERVLELSGGMQIWVLAPKWFLFQNLLLIGVFFSIS